METEKDQELWYIAKKRVSFKRQLAAYLIMNTFFWVLWYFTGKEGDDSDFNFPWPIWPMLGWGIGLSFGYVKAYVYPKSNAIEREYQKLKNK